MEIENKKVQIVMLPTSYLHLNSIIKHKTTSKLGICKCSPKNPDGSDHHDAHNWEAQHLYLLSDEEVKEGDWCYEEETGNIFQAKEFTKSGLVRSNVETYILDSCEKIIATTDTSLELPQPSQDFIKVFVEEYNKGNVIEWVDVEYKISRERNGYYSKHKKWYKLKVNSKNEITIRKIKDSWSREEVKELCNLYEAILHGDTWGESEENMWKRIKELKP